MEVAQKKYSLFIGFRISRGALETVETGDDAGNTIRSQIDPVTGVCVAKAINTRQFFIYR